jgi:hypothetical protein
MKDEQNIYDAAKHAAEHAQNAVERATRHGHRARRKTAHAVARTYLEQVYSDDERVAEARGMAMRRLERKEALASE